MGSNPSLVPEIGPDGIAREAPVISYTEKIIEEEQLQLRKYIEENYSKIRDVERELSNLTMEMKLTAGPKKAALEHLRKKIEIQTEKIRMAKLKEEQTRKVWEEAAKAVKDEEEIKQKLCEDLNKLVQESSNTQFSRLEELKRRLEALNPNRASASSPHGGAATDVASGGPAAAPGAGTMNDQRNKTSAAAAATTTAAATATAGNNKNPGAEGDAKKKKIQGRGRGIGAIPKSRGSQASGWTGAGFDVDGGA